MSRKEPSVGCRIDVQTLAELTQYYAPRLERPTRGAIMRLALKDLAALLRRADKVQPVTTVKAARQTLDKFGVNFGSSVVNWDRLLEVSEIDIKHLDDTSTEEVEDIVADILLEINQTGK